MLRTLRVWFLVLAGLASYAVWAKDDTYKTSADTAHGRYECVDDIRSGISTIKYANRVLYRGVLGEMETWDGSFKTGIPNAAGGCPIVVSAADDYVIAETYLNRPTFGELVYIVIDFSEGAPEWSELVLAVERSDAKISDKARVVWSKKGFVLNYYGYPASELFGGKKSAPKRHAVQYDFKSGNVVQLK